MIAFVRGKLAAATPSHVIIEAGGIGYEVTIAAPLYNELPPIGQNVLLYTAYVVREDSHTLYGFLSEAERQLFFQLTAVSGVGPKMALALIGNLGIEGLEQALLLEDHKSLSRVPGVGKKTAERLVIELRDKLTPAPARGAQKNLSLPAHLTAVRDTVQALENLGYGHAVATEAVKRVVNQRGEDLALPDLIQAALKSLH